MRHPDTTIRSTNMPPRDISEERLKEILNSVLDERDRIDHELHKDHHEWIRRQIEAEAKAKERWETFKKSVIGAIAVATTGAIIKGLAFIGGVILAAGQHGRTP